MTWIKICGTTNLEDAELAVEAGADAVGFVFYEQSPRNIDPDTAREVVAKLPLKVEKIGVFVNTTAAQVGKIARHAGITGVQLHADFSRPACSTERDGLCWAGRTFFSLPAEILLGKEEEWIGLAKSEVELPEQMGFHFDSRTQQLPGGTGQAFDWEAAKPAITAISRNARVVVAGGLNADNVVQAIRTLSPWGVDVASGVEAKPGKKDPAKVRAFVQAVRAAEKNS
jgi:phosphoribosylanthranilate isomerase